MCKYAVQIQHSSKINMDQRRCPTIFRKCLGVELEFLSLQRLWR